MSTLERSEDEPDEGADGGPASEPEGEPDEEVLSTLAVSAPEAGTDPDDEADEADEDADTDGSTLERSEEEDPLDVAEIRIDPGRVRHAPRFGRFATVGGLLGLVLAFLLAPLARYENLNVPWHFDPWGLALVLAAILIPVGILVGCVFALVSDRRSRRRLRD